MNPYAPSRDPKSKNEPNIRPFLLFFISIGLFLVIGSLSINFLGMYYGLILTQFTAIFGTALVYRKIRARDPEAPTWPTIRHTNTSALNLALILLTTVVLGMFANFFGSLLVELIPPLKPLAEESQKAFEDLLFNATPYQQILGAISISIVAPICEETLFRGAILPEQRTQKFAAAAILINGILFSAMHMSAVSFAPLIVVGAFFAFLTVRTNSLLPAIFAHSTLNIVNGIILPRLTNLTAIETIDAIEKTPPSLVQLMAITLPFTLLLAALWIWLSRRLPSSSK